MFIRLRMTSWSVLSADALMWKLPCDVCVCVCLSVSARAFCCIKLLYMYAQDPEPKQAGQTDVCFHNSQEASRSCSYRTATSRTTFKQTKPELD